MYYIHELKRKEVNNMTNLERIRREAGLTMVKLSEISGVSYPTIVKIEAGRIADVTVKTIIRLSAALGCDPRDIF